MRWGFQGCWLCYFTVYTVVYIGKITWFDLCFLSFLFPPFRLFFLVAVPFSVYVFPLFFSPLLSLFFFSFFSLSFFSLSFFSLSFLSLFFITPPPYIHTPWEDQCEWHRMTRMTGPDCAVMCNLISTHTHFSFVSCLL